MQDDEKFPPDRSWWGVAFLASLLLWVAIAIVIKNVFF